MVVEWFAGKWHDGDSRRKGAGDWYCVGNPSRLQLSGLIPCGHFFRAENGCFVKTRSTRKESSRWVNMVANFNLTWKAVCVEILNYVWRLLHPSVALWSDILNNSFRNVLLARGLKREALRLFGDSGQEHLMTPVRTVNGLAVKLQKPRTTSMTGEPVFSCGLSQILTVLNG